MKENELGLADQDTDKVDRAATDILFIANDGGLSHTLRLLAIAEAVSKEAATDSQISYATSSAQHSLVTSFSMPNAGLNVITHDPSNSGFKPEVDHFARLIEDADPRSVVIDQNSAAILAAYSLGIPGALVLNTLHLPLHRGIAGSEKASLSDRFVAEFANTALKRVFKQHLKMADIRLRDLEELSENIPLIIPEWEGYIPLKRVLPTFHYVGPVINENFEGYDIKIENEVKELAGQKPVIYLSFGGTGMGGNRLTELAHALVEQGYFVVTSLGITGGSDLQLPPQDGLVRKFIPGLSASRVADCVVSHGSQGTVHHAIITGTPIVCLPVNVDQGFHAYKAEEYGMGINVHSLKNKLDFLRLSQPGWLHRYGESIPVTKTVEAVHKVLTNPHYRYGAEATRERFGTNIDGAQKAARLILGQLA